MFYFRFHLHQLMLGFKGVEGFLRVVTKFQLAEQFRFLGLVLSRRYVLLKLVGVTAYLLNCDQTPSAS
jgi:hypothetical protein